MYNTIVINIIGGPGIGKSTVAAGVFYKLKTLGYSCELVTEYAKDLVYDGTPNALTNQISILGEQYKRMWRLTGEVQFIITDSPILLCAVYNNYNLDSFNNLVIDIFNSFINVTYKLTRSIPYSEEGRKESSFEADEIDVKLTEIMKVSDVKFESIDIDNGVDYIVNEVKKYF